MIPYRPCIVDRHCVCVWVPVGLLLTAARSAEDRVLAAQQRRTAARDELLSETIFRESGALLRGRSNQDMKKAAAAALGEDRVEAARARREAELTKLVEETHEREEAARQRREAALEGKRAVGTCTPLFRFGGVHGRSPMQLSCTHSLTHPPIPIH